MQIPEVVGVALFNGDQKSPYTDGVALRKLICQALLQYGFGKRDCNVPLRDIIEPGMTVLVKPNFVMHYNQSLLRDDLDSMITNRSFLFALITEVVAAKPAKIIIGDAPIQGCEWDLIVTKSFAQRVRKIAGEIPVTVIDFRRTILDKSDLSSGQKTNCRDSRHYVLFDLGADSLLDPIASPPGCFRITMYNPDELKATHSPGVHKYLIRREAFTADVVLNVPKLKTHRKVGLTGALKNLVGINGNKEYLPHHRIGGTAWGGDCYPGISPLKRAAEFCLDFANRRIGTKAHSDWTGRAQKLLRLHQRLFANSLFEGSWYGNDTAWRMVLDLNRILIYGRVDGTMADKPERGVYTITDAIICGQGEGPLAPTPLYVGAVTISGSAVAADIVHAKMFGFDLTALPIITNASNQFRWPLVSHPFEVILKYQDKEFPVQHFPEELLHRATPPDSWRNLLRPA